MNFSFVWFRKKLGWGWKSLRRCNFTILDDKTFHCIEPKHVKYMYGMYLKHCVWSIQNSPPSPVHFVIDQLFIFTSRTLFFLRPYHSDASIFHASISCYYFMPVYFNQFWYILKNNTSFYIFKIHFIHIKIANKNVSLNLCAEQCLRTKRKR